MMTSVGLSPKEVAVNRGSENAKRSLEPDRFNLLCSVGNGSPRICLNAHADTVPPLGISTPRAGLVGDRLHGLGACDDKASVAAMICAFAHICADEGQVRGQVDL